MTTFTTHKNFKSFDPKVSNDNKNDAADIIYQYVGRALDNQEKIGKFTTKASLKKENNNSNEEFKNFKINVEKIDRLYHIDRIVDDNDDEFENLLLICRLVYDDNNSKELNAPPSFIFVEMNIVYNYKNGVEIGNGLIYIGFDDDIHIFLDNILMEDDLKRRICLALAEDGIEYNPSVGYTHKNFKSRVSVIHNGEDIFKYLGKALALQTTYKKLTTPIESAYYLWNEEELENFRLDVVKIDRLYYIKCNDVKIFNEEHYELICRMDYADNSPPIYVQLLAIFKYDNNDIFEGGMGYVFLSKDVNLFMNTISAYDDKYPPNMGNSICQSLLEDGIIIFGDDYHKTFREAKQEYSNWIWK